MINYTSFELGENSALNYNKKELIKKVSKIGLGIGTILLTSLAINYSFPKSNNISTQITQDNHESLQIETHSSPITRYETNTLDLSTCSDKPILSKPLCSLEEKIQFPTDNYNSSKEFETRLRNLENFNCREYIKEEAFDLFKQSNQVENSQKYRSQLPKITSKAIDTCK